MSIEQEVKFGSELRVPESPTDSNEDKNDIQFRRKQRKNRAPDFA